MRKVPRQRFGPSDPAEAQGLRGEDRKRECAWLGHGAWLWEGHGMWLATGSVQAREEGAGMGQAGNRQETACGSPVGREEGHLVPKAWSHQGCTSNSAALSQLLRLLEPQPG